MRTALLRELRELFRETYEGGLPGQGTAYLDRDGGLRATLAALTAAQASRSDDGRPTIAAHARHLAFHLRVTAEWLRGVRVQRDWKASFEPQQVTDAEWLALMLELEAARAEFLGVMEELDDAAFVEAAAGMGALAHAAYHLGAIRQRMHGV